MVHLEKGRLPSTKWFYCANFEDNIKVPGLMMKVYPPIWVRVVLHKSFQHSRLSEDEQILLNNNYFLKPIYVPAYQSVVVIFLFISLVKINLFFLEGYDYSWIVYVLTSCTRGKGGRYSQTMKHHDLGWISISTDFFHSTVCQSVNWFSDVYDFN